MVTSVIFGVTVSVSDNHSRQIDLLSQSHFDLVLRDLPALTLPLTPELRADQDLCMVAGLALLGHYLVHCAVGPVPAGAADGACRRLVEAGAAALEVECTATGDVAYRLTPATIVDTIIELFTICTAPAATRLCARARLLAVREAEAADRPAAVLESLREAAADAAYELAYALDGTPTDDTVLLLECAHAAAAVADPRAEELLEIAVERAGITTELVAGTYKEENGERTRAGLALEVTSAPASAPLETLPLPPIILATEDAPLFTLDLPAPEAEVDATTLSAVAAARALFAFRNPPATESELVADQLRAHDEYIFRHKNVAFAAGLTSAAANALHFALLPPGKGDHDSLALAAHQFVSLIEYPEIQDIPASQRIANYFLFPALPRTAAARAAAPALLAAGFALNAADAYALCGDVARAAEASLVAGQKALALGLARTGAAAGDADAACLVAEVLNGDGETNVAREYFTRAFELSGRRLARARRGLARLELDAGAYGAAVQAYKDALMLEPSNGQAWFGLGTAYRSIGLQYAEPAAAAFSRAAENLPEPQDAYVNLGTCLAALGDYAGAEAALRQAIAGRRAALVGWLWLIRVLGQAGQWQELAKAWADAGAAMKGYRENDQNRLMVLAVQCHKELVAAVRAAAAGKAKVEDARKAVEAVVAAGFKEAEELKNLLK